MSELRASRYVYLHVRPKEVLLHRLAIVIDLIKDIHNSHTGSEWHILNDDFHTSLYCEKLEGVN